MARGFSVDNSGMVAKPRRASVDVTEPDGMVEVEFDRNRGVLYIHMEGFTVLRMCRLSRVRITIGDQQTDYIPSRSITNIIKNLEDGESIT